MQPPIDACLRCLPRVQLYDNPQLASTYLAAFQVTGDARFAGERNPPCWPLLSLARAARCRKVPPAGAPCEPAQRTQLLVVCGERFQGRPAPPGPACPPTPARSLRPTPLQVLRAAFLTTCCAT